MSCSLQLRTGQRRCRRWRVQHSYLKRLRRSHLKRPRHSRLTRRSRCLHRRRSRLCSSAVQTNRVCRMMYFSKAWLLRTLGWREVRSMFHVLCPSTPYL
jgi:hypothetical protein